MTSFLASHRVYFIRDQRAVAMGRVALIAEQADALSTAYFDDPSKRFFGFVGFEYGCEYSPELRHFIRARSFTALFRIAQLAVVHIANSGFGKLLLKRSLRKTAPAGLCTIPDINNDINVRQLERSREVARLSAFISNGVQHLPSPIDLIVRPDR